MTTDTTADTDTSAVLSTPTNTDVPVIDPAGASALIELPFEDSKPKAKKAPKAPKAPKKGAKAKKAPKAGKADKSAASKPTTGQSAPHEFIGVADLNAREMRLIEFLNGTGEGHRQGMTITEMLEVFRGAAGTKARANSWVRNQLRRLVTGGYAEHLLDSDGVVVRGSYRVTEAGRKRLVRASA